MTIKEKEVTPRLTRRRFIMNSVSIAGAGLLAATLPTPSGQVPKVEAAVVGTASSLNQTTLPHLSMPLEYRNLSNHSIWVRSIQKPTDIKPSTAERGHLGEPPSWDQILESFNQLTTIDPQDRTFMRVEIERARADLEPYYAQLKEFDNIARADLDEQGQPRLYQYFRGLKGKMNYRFDDTKLVPFLKELEITANTIWQINNFVEGTLYLEKAGKVDLAQTEFKRVVNRIREGREKEKVEEEWFNKLPKTYGEVSIVAAGNLENGSAKARFERYQEVILEVLELFRQVKSIRTVIELGGKEFGSGGILSKAEASGEFEMKDIPGGGGKYALLRIDVDGVKNEEGLRVYTAHELGHLLDPTFSRPLSDKLTPRHWYDLALQQQISIHDSTWGINDEDIRSIFSIKGGIREDQVDGLPRLSVQEATSLMRARAANNLLQNGFYTTENGQLVSLFNMVSIGQDKEGAIKILFDDDTLDKEYLTLDDFLGDFLPKLEQYVNDKSISSYNKPRERLVWLGLTRYKDAFESFDFIWDYNTGIVPKNSKTALTWLSYCDFIVNNATLTYGVLGNDKEITDIVFTFFDRNLFERILHNRRVSYGEFSADAVSKSRLWKDKIALDPSTSSNPFDSLFDKITSFLPQAA